MYRFERWQKKNCRFGLLLALMIVISGCANNDREQDVKALSGLSFADFISPNCTIERLEAGKIQVVISPESPCVLLLESAELKQLPESAWLSFFAEVDGLESPVANLLFWSDQNSGRAPDLTSASGLFPGLKARMSFPLTVLAEGRGAPKTPGTLIQFAFGKGLERTHWSRFGLSLMKLSGDPATVVLEDFQFTSNQPNYPVPKKKVIDRMGQWIQKDWSDKVLDENVMVSQLRDEASQAISQRPSKYSSYGGIKSQQFEASGFFRTHHDGRRWWLVDPEGYGFYSIGIDIVGPGISGNVEGIEDLHDWMPGKTGEYKDAWEEQTIYDIQNPEGKRVELMNYHTANLIRAFGSDWHNKWTQLTANRLIDWNVNTVGNWSDLDFARKAKVPYVIPLQNFPVTDKRIFRDFPDVFSPEYESRALEYAKQLEPIRNDPYLIGYFMNNEPGWAYVPSINLAEELMTKTADFVSKKNLIEFLSDQYGGDIHRLNKSWNTDFDSFEALLKPLKGAASLSSTAKADLLKFSGIMLDRYVEVPVLATKAVDSNHLNMGMRWASSALKEAWRFAGSRHLDVLSINNYSDNPAPRLDIAAKMTNKPILIGEFHHGSMEAGHSAFGARWTKTEAERVKAYRYYAENAAQHVNSIGLHYFSYNDDPVLGRFDGQNFHQGFVSVTHTPYSDFVEGYAEVNDELYDVVEGKRLPDEKYPDGMVISIPMSF